MFWDKEEEWTDNRKAVAVNVLMGSGVMVATILILDLIVMAVKKYVEWRKEKIRKRNLRFRQAVYITKNLNQKNKKMFFPDETILNLKTDE